MFSKFLVHCISCFIFYTGKRVENISVLHGTEQATEMRPRTEGGSPGDVPQQGRGLARPGARPPGDAPSRPGAWGTRAAGAPTAAEEHVGATPSEPRPRDWRLLVGATGGARHGAASRQEERVGGATRESEAAPALRHAAGQGPRRRAEAHAAAGSAPRVQCVSRVYG